MRSRWPAGGPRRAAGALALVLCALLLGLPPTSPSAPSEGVRPSDAAAGPAATPLLGTDRAGWSPRVQARPDTDPDDEDAFTVPDEAILRVDSPHFRVHLTEEGADAATRAFAKEVLAVLEEVRRIQVEQLGWPAPLPDDDLGGRGLDGAPLIDVYLVDLEGDAFGYAAADPEAVCRTCDRVHGYLVLDDDYAGFRPDPAGALRATAAHEFSHLVQFGLAYAGEGWAYEATAVWLEQATFPSVDARTQYLPDFAAAPDLPLSDFDEGSGGFDRAYGAYVWNLWLADRHGPDVVRDAWLAAAQAGDSHILAGYGAALRDRGTLLERELVAFTAATAAWEAGGFPEEPVGYPVLERQQPLPRGSTTEVQVDQVAAHIADVEAGGGRVTATVRGPKFVAGGIALVAVADGEVIAQVDATLFDGHAEVTLDAAGADRVTLVVVNADPALAVPTPPGSDRPRYLFADVPYRIGVDVDPGPPAKR